MSLKRTLLIACLLPLFWFLASPSFGQAPGKDIGAPPKSKLHPPIKKEDEKLFQSVLKRLLSSEVVTKEYPKKFAWPPLHYIKPKSAREMNAYASSHELFGAKKDKKSGKVRPIVTITQGLLNAVVKGDENVLAAIMGHELAHLIKDHVSGRKGKTALLLLAFNREREIEADLQGMRFAVSAGYPYKDSIVAAVRIMKKIPNYSSFEGLHAGHPSWEERLILLDRKQSEIWKSMAAFRNGTLFLKMEQYQSAEQCFEVVVREFPDCYEGWANLGYARLMRYVDALTVEDLEEFQIGQVAAGSFYLRAKSLSGKLRAADLSLWRAAHEALTRALKLKSDLILPRANLGVAYLFHPLGADAKSASECFEQALARLEMDSDELKKNPMAKASLMINAGVAELALGKTAEATKRFEKAARHMRSIYSPLVRSLHLTLLYNQSLADERAAMPNKKRAFGLLGAYLRQASPDSAWWKLAWKRYARLGKELKEPVRGKKEFQKVVFPSPLRPITSVEVGTRVITLSEPTDEAVSRLGRKSGVAIPLAPKSSMVRWHFSDADIDLLGNEKLLAMFLRGPKAPPVFVQAAGLGAEKKELRVGMSEKELTKLLPAQRADGIDRHIADAKVAYRFYRRLGLAVRIKDGNVQELAIAQLPYFQIPKKGSASDKTGGLVADDSTNTGSDDAGKKAKAAGDHAPAQSGSLLIPFAVFFLWVGFVAAVTGLLVWLSGTDKLPILSVQHHSYALAGLLLLLAGSGLVATVVIGIALFGVFSVFPALVLFALLLFLVPIPSALIPGWIFARRVGARCSSCSAKSARLGGIPPTKYICQSCNHEHAIGIHLGKVAAHSP